jgi:hypothetical protein
MFTELLACKCEGPFSIEKEYPRAKVVFLGQVLKVEYVGLGETMHPDSLLIARKLAAAKNTEAFLDSPIVLKASFLVKKEYKGQLQVDTLTIYTGYWSASCGFNFKANKEYLVYGVDYSLPYSFLQLNNERVNRFTKKHTYWTHYCMRTTEDIHQEQTLLTKYLRKE